MGADYPFTGFADHGVSEAAYLNDPDEIGVELCADRPRSEWQTNPDGSAVMAAARVKSSLLFRTQILCAVL
ncbi:MAG: catechol 2,3-dioxygenase [Candidatus Marinamargulisbacteria bacterium]|jgi:catechol 2,3-dioxygenase